MAVKNAEEYISCHTHWEEELRQLHEMILTTDLKSEIKWGAPVYTLNGKNVLGIGAFKNHFGIWFFNGALLKENTSLLVNAQEGKTKALRQIRFEKGDEIKTSTLLPYIKEAIQNQREDKELKPVIKKKLVIPSELAQALKNDPKLDKSFNTLTPGKQREYADHILEAKREATKLSRIEKITPMIKRGEGLHDKYKNC
ncbi:YdeI/OmpD-associated family protein [Christiangramia sp. SM2212]|uniref:YdeI/OmpD-associated family protein n=1 Tax=Christiangramia sediminicola TaxID=3073267 RepID=A0ABU1ERE6_9FLAO|nr:YdeI/OmpD-associated family protein [Christiangramia sp. SM2212]MDR5590962.1 YdeI/OmpD-associated family protein [Christiangramia sp. SM2212]